MVTTSVWPTSLTIQHQVYQFVTDSGGNPVLDADGNATGSLAAPVDRKIIGFQQDEGEQGADAISPDYVERTVTGLVMEVPDGTIYNKLDVVSLQYGGLGPSTDWVAYQVQGHAPTWRLGFPWRRYAGLFADTVSIRRVT
jgi:hypothetical protein